MLHGIPPKCTGMTAFVFLVINFAIVSGSIHNVSGLMSANQAKFLEIFTKTILTEDQILLLQDCDSVVTGHYPGLKDLNINGMTVETVLPDYIFRFRDSGQFNRD